MDLRSFSEATHNKSTSHSNEQHSNSQEHKNDGGMSEKDVRRAINFFSKMSDDQLMRELGKHLAKKKQQGKQSEVLSMVETIKPFLNDEQRKRLTQIMESFN